MSHSLKYLFIFSDLLLSGNINVYLTEKKKRKNRANLNYFSFKCYLANKFLLQIVFLFVAYA